MSKCSWDTLDWLITPLVSVLDLPANHVDLWVPELSASPFDTRWSYVLLQHRRNIAEGWSLHDVQSVISRPWAT